MKKIIVIVTFLIGSSLLAQNVKYDQVDVYKKTETRDLNISFVFPDNWKERTQWPMIVFYHGGGWAGGDIKQFSSQAAYFAAGFCFGSQRPSPIAQGPCTSRASSLSAAEKAKVVRL